MGNKRFRKVASKVLAVPPLLLASAIADSHNSQVFAECITGSGSGGDPENCIVIDFPADQCIPDDGREAIVEYTVTVSGMYSADNYAYTSGVNINSLGMEMIFLNNYASLGTPSPDKVINVQQVVEYGGAILPAGTVSEFINIDLTASSQFYSGAWTDSAILTENITDQIALGHVNQPPVIGDLITAPYLSDVPIRDYVQDIDVTADLSDYESNSADITFTMTGTTQGVPFSQTYTYYDDSLFNTVTEFGHTFTDVPVGEFAWVVEVTETDAYGVCVSTVNADPPININLTSDSVENSIGSANGMFVGFYVDDNNNGVREGGESWVTDVGVTVTDSQGLFTGSTLDGEVFYYVEEGPFTMAFDFTDSNVPAGYPLPEGFEGVIVDGGTNEFYFGIRNHEDVVEEVDSLSPTGLDVVAVMMLGVAMIAVGVAAVSGKIKKLF